MPNFFKSFFSGKSEDPENEKQKTAKKNFEIFKYDGLRAQRMGRPDYAIKCFTEALAIEEDFETLSYLSQLYVQLTELDKAREILNRMVELEPTLTSTYLALANVCYMQEDYKSMETAAQKAIEIEEGNAMAHYLLGKATQGMNDDLMAIGHLTKAIVLKDDFIEARLLRAEALVKMNQLKEAAEDIEAVLAQNPDDEAAILLHGKTTGSRRKARRSRDRLSESHGGKSIQRTGLPLSRTTLYHTEETDRGYQSFRRSNRIKSQLRKSLSRTWSCQTAER